MIHINFLNKQLYSRVFFQNYCHFRGNHHSRIACKRSKWNHNRSGASKHDMDQLHEAESKLKITKFINLKVLKIINIFLLWMAEIFSLPALRFSAFTVRKFKITTKKKTPKIARVTDIFIITFYYLLYLRAPNATSQKHLFIY